MRSTLVATAISSILTPISALDILGVIGQDCHGETLFSRRINTPNSDCINITTSLDTGSIAMGSFQPDQAVVLYGRPNCAFDGFIALVEKGNDFCALFQ